MASLIFIDTNIWLDFYRVVGRQGDLSILDRLDLNWDKIITGDQVEMEFKKNRPRVIIESYEGLRNPDWKQPRLPAYLHRSKQSSGLKSGRKRIENQLKTLRTRVGKVFKNPTRSDPVYKAAQRIFRHDGPLSLSRKKKARHTIRRLAGKRWILGYPPRKPGDNSIGDAINWEWIIRCASDTSSDVVIVSRDSDFGVQFAGTPHLNDWLAQEFRERVGRTRKINLTDRLVEALRIASIKVTRAEEKAEDELLEELKKTKRAGRDLTSAWWGLQRSLGDLEQFSSSPFLKGWVASDLQGLLSQGPQGYPASSDGNGEDDEDEEGEVEGAETEEE